MSGGVEAHARSLSATLAVPSRLCPRRRILLAAQGQGAHLQQLRGRGVVGEQIQGPGHYVGPRPPTVVVHRRLAFLKYLDCRKSSNLVKKIRVKTST